MCACDVRFNGIEKLYIVLVKRLVWAVSGKILELTQASDGDAVTASHQARSGKPDVVSKVPVNADGWTESPLGPLG